MSETTATPAPATTDDDCGFEYMFALAGSIVLAIIFFGPALEPILKRWMD